MPDPVTCIDALANAVRDTICAATGLAKYAECDVTPDGRPNPDCGERFVAVHSFSLTNNSNQCLDELYSFTVTVTIRTDVLPQDRTRDGKAWALALPIRAILHMSDACITLAASYDTEGVEWVEPMMFTNGSQPQPKGADWFFSEDAESSITGLSIDLNFKDARRVQYISQEID